jgi:mono/diheme cytochrome c family protein
MGIQIRATILAVATSAFVLGLTFGLAPALRSSQTDASRNAQKVTRPEKLTVNSVGLAEQGYNLFDRNCAHCHGEDARGGEGPTLYNLAMSDGRIAKRIKEGIKGEMPKFDGKFNDLDIATLIVYLRTLKD